MVEMGMFGDGERVELLYGQLVAMSPIGTRHAWSVRQLTQSLVLALRRRAEVQVQSPVAASDVSEPEPDLAVLPAGKHLDRHPSRGLLVIEVADTSLRVDRRIKARLYAEMGVPEYWIVNLVNAVVEAHHQPAATGYRKIMRHRRGETIRLRCFPDVELGVSEFVPPRRAARTAKRK